MKKLLLTVLFIVQQNTSLINAKSLSIKETSELISKLYNELGVQIGSHLLEPNALLTLAGLRGSGNFLIHSLSSEQRDKIEKANKALQDKGIKFTIAEYEETFDIDISNLNGYETSSTKSKLPFVEPYNSSTGFKGLYVWSGKICQNIEKHFKYEPNKSINEEHQHLLGGIYLGYPDQALLDHLVANIDELVLSEIPYADYYDNPQPNFLYLPKHANEESIVQTINEWGKFFEEFYKGQWYQSIAKDKTLLEMIESEKKAHDDWFKKYRLQKN